MTLGPEPGSNEFFCVSRDLVSPLMAANIQAATTSDFSLIKSIQKTIGECSFCPLQQGIGAILPGNEWLAEKEEYNAKPFRWSQTFSTSLPFILEAEKINYYYEKPVSKVIVTDIRYEMSKATYQKKPPQNLNALTVINRSHIPQNIAKTVEYTTSSSSEYSFGVGIGFGTEVTLFETEKKIGPAKIEVGVTGTYETEHTFSYGQSETVETTDTIEIGMEISWTSKMTVTISADKFTSNIPFIATMKKYYFDGTTGTSTTDGIFKGVHMSNVHVQYGLNKQLDADGLAGKAEDIVNENVGERDLCHDPRNYSTKNT